MQGAAWGFVTLSVNEFCPKLSIHAVTLYFLLLLLHGANSCHFLLMSGYNCVIHMTYSTFSTIMFGNSCQHTSTINIIPWSISSRKLNSVAVVTLMVHNAIITKLKYFVVGRQTKLSPYLSFIHGTHPHNAHLYHHQKLLIRVHLMVKYQIQMRLCDWDLVQNHVYYGGFVHECCFFITMSSFRLFSFFRSEFRQFSICLQRRQFALKPN